MEYDTKNKIHNLGKNHGKRGLHLSNFYSTKRARFVRWWRGIWILFVLGFPWRPLTNLAPGRLLGRILTIHESKIDEY